jgi:hypothetical protein
MKDQKITLQNQHQLLSRHCAPGTLISLDEAVQQLQPSWCSKLVPVLVPQFGDGEQYRRLLVDIHADLTKQEPSIDQVPDDAFFPADAVGVRFTVTEFLWRGQSQIVAQFQKGGVVTGLGLFAASLYLLDMCTAHNIADAIAHPMWSNTVSNQAAVLVGKKGVFIRSESTKKGSRAEFNRLVVAAQQCRTSLAPFFLNDLRMP